MNGRPVWLYWAPGKIWQSLCGHDTMFCMTEGEIFAASQGIQEAGSGRRAKKTGWRVTVQINVVEESDWWRCFMSLWSIMVVTSHLWLLNTGGYRFRKKNMAEDPTRRSCYGQEPWCWCEQQQNANCLKLKFEVSSRLCMTCGAFPRSLENWLHTCLLYVDLCVSLFYLSPQLGSVSGGERQTARWRKLVTHDNFGRLLSFHRSWHKLICISRVHRPHLCLESLTDPRHWWHWGKDL